MYGMEHKNGQQKIKDEEFDKLMDRIFKEHKKVLDELAKH